MISNPIYGKIKNGNQTTNQISLGIAFHTVDGFEITRQPEAAGHFWSQKKTQQIMGFSWDYKINHLPTGDFATIHRYPASLFHQTEEKPVRLHRRYCGTDFPV